MNKARTKQYFYLPNDSLLHRQMLPLCVVCTKRLEHCLTSDKSKYYVWNLSDFHFIEMFLSCSVAQLVKLVDFVLQLSENW